MGIVPIREALRIAEEQGYDLVEVSPDSTPPVCRILDYGKYRYQLNKKHSRHRTISIKEIKVRPQIGKHDLDLKIRNIKRFMEDGDKVKVTLMFRGREIVHSSLAKKVFDSVLVELTDKVNIDQPPKLEGRQMVMVLSPKS